MPKDTQPDRACLHGYQPLVVDENSLSDEERRHAIISAVVQPRDWSRHITPHERHVLEQELADVQKQAELQRRNGVFYAGEPPAMTAKRAELAQRGLMRAIAREKHGDVWLGDGPPPWSY